MLKAMRMCFENLLIFELLSASISTLALLFIFFILKKLEEEREVVSVWAYRSNKRKRKDLKKEMPMQDENIPDKISNEIQKSDPIESPKENILMEEKADGEDE